MTDPDERPDPHLHGRHWYLVPAPVFTGENDVTLLRGGDELFPAMCSAIRRARKEVMLATYIFHDDPAAQRVMEALEAAAQRGVDVRVVIDGFGSKSTLPVVQRRLQAAGVSVAVFRPLDRWTHWLQPGQLRRLHMKLCVVDGVMGYVGGINVIDDRIDLHHGHTDRPRLDYAVAVYGPAVAAMEQVTRAMWSRAWFGRDWADELQGVLRTTQPIRRLRHLFEQLRLFRRPLAEPGDDPQPPVRAAFMVRDNLRQRRSIERAYVGAIQGARHRVWLVTPYFYPAPAFRRALGQAARRGVDVRLLLQGKIDYRLAGIAARVLYEDLMHQGVQIFEYTPAFLHAKAALVDDAWATVGSSNIDPLSLLLNLEANLVVEDAGFANALANELAQALSESHPVTVDEARENGWGGWPRRVAVAWAATIYLRLAGVTGRY